MVVMSMMVAVCDGNFCRRITWEEANFAGVFLSSNQKIHL